MFFNCFRKAMMIWVVVVVVMAGCQSDSVNNPVAISSGEPTVQQQADGPLGGLLGIVNRLLGAIAGLVTRATGGSIHLLTSDFVVPPNAIPSSSAVIMWSIFEQSPSGLVGGLNKVHLFGPEHLQFQVPCTLYVSYTDAGVGNNNATLYRCYYFNEDTGNWEPQVTVVDTINRRFIVTIHHFSRYAFGR